MPYCPWCTSGVLPVGTPGRTPSVYYSRQYTVRVLYRPCTNPWCTVPSVYYPVVYRTVQTPYYPVVYRTVPTPYYPVVYHPCTIPWCTVPVQRRGVPSLYNGVVYHLCADPWCTVRVPYRPCTYRPCTDHVPTVRVPTTAIRPWYIRGLLWLLSLRGTSVGSLAAVPPWVTPVGCQAWYFLLLLVPLAEKADYTGRY